MATCIFLFRLLILPTCSRRDKRVLSNVRSHVEVCYSTINDMHLSPSSFTLAFLITAAENFVKFPMTYNRAKERESERERERKREESFIHLFIL